MLGVQLAPYLARHRAAFDFVFADAPRAATGEPEEGIPPEVRPTPSPNPNPDPNPTPNTNPKPKPNPNQTPTPTPTPTRPQP